MIRTSAVFLVMVAAACAGCVRQAFVEPDFPSEDPAKRFSVPIGEEFELGLGDTAVLEGTEIEITFSVLDQDSRCPSDVTCITAGQATILLRISYPIAIGNTVTASIPGLVPTPFVENDAIRIDGASIKLLRLSPYPVSDEPRGPADYRALLVVER